MKRSPEPVTEDEVAHYAREYKFNGKTFSRIAIENGRHEETVRKHVWKYLSERDHKI